MAREKKYFMHYWETPTVLHQEAALLAGEPWAKTFDHTASNFFGDKKVRVGDVVYAINFANEVLYVIGRMTVAEIIGYDEAKRRLPYEPWDATDHLIAEPGATAVSFDAFVPDAELDQIRRVMANGKIAGPKRRPDGSISEQTFSRTSVREITAATARLLDACLRATQQ